MHSRVGQSYFALRRPSLFFAHLSLGLLTLCQCLYSKTSPSTRNQNVNASAPRPPPFQLERGTCVFVVATYEQGQPTESTRWFHTSLMDASKYVGPLDAWGCALRRVMSALDSCALNPPLPSCACCSDHRIKNTYLKAVRYAVFGLGNSLYKDNFNRVARELDVAMASLMCVALLQTCRPFFRSCVPRPTDCFP